jgi:myo-inositol 2-dehydrogenase/D-chiro-inositol 1-dehydrogenase
MIHDFDMAMFLAGCDVTEVYAMGASLVDPRIGQAGDVDTAIVTLTFANGALGVIDNSRRAAYGYDQRVEVFGSLGMAADENDGAPPCVYPPWTAWSATSPSSSSWSATWVPSLRR